MFMRVDKILDRSDVVETGLIKLSHAKKCLKKKQYTEKNAKEVALKRSKKINKEIVAYLCTFCRCWHIGHKSLKEE